MSIAALLADLGLSQRDVARGANLSKSVVGRLVLHGQWPTRNGGRAFQQVEAYLRGHGATQMQLLALIRAPAKKLVPESCELSEAVSPEPVETQTQEEETMLLQNQALTLEAKEHFAVRRNPFIDEVNTRDDVFTSGTTATGSVRYVRQALLEAAQNHGFLAIVGESGSGKTTLREEFEERIRTEKKPPVIVIKPYIIGMEANDVKGKTMKVSAIADAIARTLAPGLTLKSSSDARFEQVKKLLVASMEQGNAHLIVIEEAHRLPQATLRHLKGFMEMKEGLRRLLGVCLIGQPELDHLLGASQRDIREIVQRCERVTLAPIARDLEAYLAHKFERAGLKASAVLASDAYDAIRTRLEYVPRGGTRKDTVSICYPLVVNNLVCAAMNLAAERGWPQVDAQVIGAV